MLRQVTHVINKHVLLVFLDPILNPPVQPYGLSILKSELEKENIQSDIILPFFETDPVSYFKQRLNELQPGIVGFSLRNLDVASFNHSESVGINNTFLPLLKRMVDVCRENTDKAIAIGGSGFSIAPIEILKFVNADVGFIGPSEHDFVTYCKRCFDMQSTTPDQSKLLDGLTSVVLPDSSKPNSFRKTSISANVPIFPKESIEVAKILGGTIPIRTKTGCNLKCSYCVVPSIDPLEFRSSDSVLKEIEFTIENGFGNRIFFADGEFNLPGTGRAINLCNEMNSRFSDLVKWRCYICPSNVNEDLVQSMKKAGCIWVSLTADAYEDNALIGLGKKHTAKQAIEATELFLKYGIEVNVNLIFGGPGDTRESINETLNITKMFLHKGAHFSPIFGVRIYPNTPLYEVALREEHKEFVSWYLEKPHLGIYTRPFSRNELGEIFLEHFPKNEKIHHAKTFKELETNFNLRLTSAIHKFIQGNVTDAESELREIRKSYPTRVEASLALAKVLRAQNKLEDAFNLLNHLD